MRRTWVYHFFAQRNPTAVADPRFFRRGRQLQWGCQIIIWSIFAENYVKIKKIGRGGGVNVPWALLQVDLPLCRNKIVVGGPIRHWDVQFTFNHFIRLKYLTDWHFNIRSVYVHTCKSEEDDRITYFKYNFIDFSPCNRPRACQYKRLCLSFMQLPCWIYFLHLCVSNYTWKRTLSTRILIK